MAAMVALQSATMQEKQVPRATTADTPCASVVGLECATWAQFTVRFSFGTSPKKDGSRPKHWENRRHHHCTDKG
jgi:hypothetical protein